MSRWIPQFRDRAPVVAHRRHTLLRLGLASGLILSLTGFQFSGAISPLLPNHATPDETWWARHNPALTIQAAVSGTTPHPLVTLAPNTPVVLTASWTASKIPAPAFASPLRWIVNSPDATLTPLARVLSWFTRIPDPDSMGGLQTVSSFPEQFVATRPGIYTVQAFWHHQASVPLVITVGLAALVRATPAWTPPPAATTGVLPSIPPQFATDPRVPLTTVAPHLPGLHLIVQRPIHGWLPVHGTIPISRIDPPASRTVTVQLIDDPHGATYRAWDYTMPLSVTGAFADRIHIPWHGRRIALWCTVNLNGVLPLHYADSTVTWPINGTTLGATLLTNPAPSLTASVIHHLASGDINLNQPSVLRPYAHIALALWTHAPSPQTGAVAIANWIAERTAYNFQEEDSGPIPWATATQTLHAEEGVCENYATALATLYDSIGLSAHMVVGIVRNATTPTWTNTPASPEHAWVTVRIDHHWLTVDPTWNSSESLPINTITNAYTTQTTLFKASHHALTSTYAVNP